MSKTQRGKVAWPIVGLKGQCFLAIQKAKGKEIP